MALEAHPGVEAAFDALEHAEGMWQAAVCWEICALPVGTEFLAEDIAGTVKAKGYHTRDRRAMGALILLAERGGWIEKTDHYRKAETSHCSPKRVWRRRQTP